MAHRTHPSRRGASGRSRTPGGAPFSSRPKRRDAAKTAETEKTAEAPDAPDARNGASGPLDHGTAPVEPPAPRLDDPVADVPLAGPPTRIDARASEPAAADLGGTGDAADDDETAGTGGIASPAGDAGDRVGNTKRNSNTEMDIDMDTDIGTDTDTNAAADPDRRDGCEDAPFARDPGCGGASGAGRAPGPGRAPARQRAASMDDALRAYLRDPTPERAERLVRETRGFVYSTALRIVRDPWLAEDVVQEVYLRFFEETRRAFGPGTASLVSDCVDLGRGVLRLERARRARRPAASQARRGRGGVSLDDDEDEPRAGRLERSTG